MAVGSLDEVKAAVSDDATIVDAGDKTILRHSWERGSAVGVHGWVYSIADGIVKGLCTHKADGLQNDDA